MKDKIINIRVSKELKDRIKKAAKEEGLQMTSFITRILTLAIKQDKRGI